MVRVGQKTARPALPGSIKFVITTTDAMGNPVPYATFSLKRDAGKARNPDYNKFVAANGTMRSNSFTMPHRF